MSREIRLNDFGIRILVQFTDAGSPTDFTTLSSISTLEHCFNPPCAAVKTLVATFASAPTLAGSTFTGDGSDGWTETTIVSSDFWDESGLWRLQGRVAALGLDFRSSRVTFTVFENDCP